MINFLLQDIDKGRNHCALVASYRKSCTPSKLIACSCFRLPSPLRYPREVSNLVPVPTLLQAARSIRCCSSFGDQNYTAPGRGSKSLVRRCPSASPCSFTPPLSLHPSIPPSLLSPPGPSYFLLPTSATVSLLASLLISVLFRYYPRPGSSSSACSSLPGSPDLALALALVPALAALAMNCLERLQPSVYCWCLLDLVSRGLSWPSMLWADVLSHPSHGRCQGIHSPYPPPFFVCHHVAHTATVPV